MQAKEVIKELDGTVKEIQSKIENLQKQQESVLATKDAYCEVNDICPTCLGDGYYYKQSSGGDPYERSSDLREDCPVCNGTGKFYSSGGKK